MKEQAQILQSLIGNYQTFIDIREDFSNNEHLGSALAENSAYVDSLSGRLNHLKEVWVSIGQTMVSSDFLKTLLDGAIALSEGIDWLVKALDNVGALTPVLTSVAVTFSSMMKTMVGNSRNNVGIFTPRETAFTTLIQDIKNTEGLGNKLKATWTGTFKTLNSGASALGKNLLNAGKFMGSFIGQGLLVAGVTFAIEQLVKWVDNLANGLENTEKTIKTTIEDLNTSITNNQNNLDYLEQTEDRYNELIAKKKEYNNTPLENINQEQMKADMQELRDITNELADMFPELVVGYDSEGSPILLMANDMEKLKQKTKEQIALEQELLEIQRKELADNARQQIDGTGNVFTDTVRRIFGNAPISEDIDLLKAKYNSLYSSMQGSYESYLNALSNGDEKQAQKALKNYKEQEKNLQETYAKRLELYKEYSQNELEIQQSIFDKLKKVQGYEGLDESQASVVNSLFNSLNWANLDDGQTSTWVNSFEKVISSVKDGQPIVSEWNKEIEKANAKFSANGDIEEYNKSLESIAKTISKDLSIPYETVFSGLENISKPLEPAEQALQDFLKTFKKTRYDLLNGDSIAEGLATQFKSVQSIINDILSNGSIYDDKGTIKLPILMQIANTDSLPDQVQKIISNFTKDGKSTAKETQVVIDLMYVLNEGDTEEARKKIEEINKTLKSMGQEPIDIDLLFNTEGLEEVQNIEETINKLREQQTTKDIVFNIDGVDRAEYILEIIQKLQTTPELTNKFILENIDAIGQLENFAQVKEYISKNPDIIAKYQIKGIEEAKKTVGEIVEQKKELEKPTESTTTVNYVTKGGQELVELNGIIEDAEGEKEVSLSVDNGQVLDAIDDVETLIKYSAEVKDGKYKLDIEANTQKAVEEIEALEKVLKNVQTILVNTPTTTFNIVTALASKNVTGLRNNIEKYQDLASKIKTLTFKSETAQASKNITGLRKNVTNYISDIKEVKTLVFKAETAQASKNITGLRNNLQSYLNLAGKVKTITFNTNTSKASKSISNLLGSLGASKATKTIGVSAEFVGDNSNLSIPTPQVDNVSTETNVTVTPRATLQTPLAIKGFNIAEALEFDIDLLKELEARLSMITNQLGVLDKKAESALGTEKIKYLQQQNELYKEQMNVLKEQEDALQRQANYMKYTLERWGITFNADGNMTNYEELLIEREKKLKTLEAKANRDNATNSQKQAYENARESLDKLKKYADTYYEVTFSELPKVQEEWYELANIIRENSSAIKELEREQKLYTFNNSLRELSMLQDVIADKVDIINQKLTYADEPDRIKYQEELNRLLEEEIQILEQQMKQYEESMKIYQEELQGFGFTFDSEGTIQNLQKILNQYQNSQDLEDINNILEEYFEIQRDALPDLIKQWQSVKNEILSSSNAVNTLKDSLEDLAKDSELKGINRDIADIENRLNKAELAFNNNVGDLQISALKDRIELTKQLSKELQDLIAFENNERQDLMSDLGAYGFSFRDDGSIIGYSQQIEKLKNTLSETEFDKVFTKIEDYLNTTYETIPDLEERFIELGFSVEDYANQLQKLERQQSLELHLNRLQQIEIEYDNLADALDLIDIKMENAYGSDKLQLIEKQIELLEQQRDKQNQVAREYEKIRDIYQQDLSKYGFEFTDDGDIKNLNDIFEKFSNDRDIENIKELVEEYLEVQRDLLPEATKEWEELSATIKEAYKEQLRITKEIEDEITDIYKKQKEERIKLINQELDARLTALKKEQQAYNDMRAEADYQDEYNEQIETIANLEKQIEIAKRDTSLSGQKRLQDLLAELKDEQKKLQDLVQDRIDDQVNDMFDKESDRLTEEAEGAIEDLESTFSDEKIAELVKEALNTGVFEDIDGTMRSLQDVMLEFVDKYGEGLGATGQLIKNELIANLEVAKNMHQEMLDIYKQLGTMDYTYDSNILGNASRSIPQGRSEEGQNVVVHFNESLITIEGNVTEDILPEVERMVQQAKDEVVNEIVRGIR